MKVLLVKQSSMGDVLHTLPAVCDLKRALPQCEVHWVVEEAFASIVHACQAVDKVIPIQFRHWRKHLWQSFKQGHIQQFLQALRSDTYDVIIDAQGLLKSALIARLAKGPIYGYDKYSIREPLAAYGYQHKIKIERKQHAITRIRQLFSRVFRYELNERAPLQYQLKFEGLSSVSFDKPYVVLLVNTTWQTKLWPDVYWQSLLGKLVAAGYGVVMVSGNKQEYRRIQAIQGNFSSEQVKIFPRQSIDTVALILQGAQKAISVDTGFAHLAAALELPQLSLFGPTDPMLSGPKGTSQQVLIGKMDCHPCLKKSCKMSNEKPLCMDSILSDSVFNKL